MSKRNKSEVKMQIKGKRFLVFIGLVLFFLINIASSSRPLLSLYGVLKFGECAFLGAYLAKTISSRIQFQQITLLFGISGVYESVLAILQYVNQGSLNGIFYFLGERTFTGATPGIANVSLNGTLTLRPYATFSHPNVLAGFLIIGIVLVWSFLLKSNRVLIKTIAIGSLVISSIALLLTFSRIAILLWILLVVMLFLRRVLKKVKTAKAKIIFSLAALLMLVLINFFPLTQEILSRFSNSSLSDESVTQRVELLTTSWDMIIHHPLLGVGVLNFIPSSVSLQKPLALGLYLQPAHNIFVLVLVETGVVGLGIFIWLLAVTFLTFRKQDSGNRNVFLVLLIIIFVTGLFDHYWLTLQQGQLLFASVIGLSWAKIKKQSKQF